MSNIYYQLSDGTNTLLFTTSFDETLTREIWENGIPYTNPIMMTDQVSTKDEMSLTAHVKAGTGQPYATVIAALSAIRAIVKSGYSTGFTLKGGDWNGTSWAYNSLYPFELGDTIDNKILQAMIRINFAEGESYSDGELTVTITIKIGTVI
jgi:hypothetical protein